MQIKVIVAALKALKSNRRKNFSKKSKKVLDIGVKEGVY